MCQKVAVTLPPERTSLTRLFTHTGPDFAAPFYIKSYIGHGCLITTGYMAVFVCYATKAAFTRFSARFLHACLFEQYNRLENPYREDIQCSKIHF